MTLVWIHLMRYGQRCKESVTSIRQFDKKKTDHCPQTTVSQLSDLWKAFGEYWILNYFHSHMQFMLLCLS